MKWTSWAFLAFLGSLAFLVLFIADQQMNAADPHLKLVSERSPYMRTER